MKYFVWCDETSNYAGAYTMEEAVVEAKALIKDAMIDEAYDVAECVIYKAVQKINGVVSVDFNIDSDWEGDTDEDSKSEEPDVVDVPKPEPKAV